MTAEDNKAILVRHYKDVIEGGRVELIDSYFAQQGNSPERFGEFITWLHKICTKIKVTVLDMVAEGEKVVVHVQFELTCSSKYLSEYTGEYPPLDQPHTWTGLEFFQFVDGKYVSMVSFYDSVGRHWPARKVS